MAEPSEPTPPTTNVLAFLRPAWLQALDRTNLRADVVAALSAVGLTLPLALLMALHAGIPYYVSLITLAVGSGLVAVFGGSTFGLSGPGLAMGFALIAMAQRFGPSGLAFAGLLCGLLQLVAGTLRLGRYARMIPLSVVHGFVWGLGALLLVQAFPHALGLEAPNALRTLELLDYIGARLDEVNPVAIAMAVGSFALVYVRIRRAWRLPVGMFAIIACSAIQGLAGLDQKVLPDLPFRFSVGEPPAMPSHDITQFVAGVLALFALSSLETLLSASATEERRPEHHHEPNVDLIGHGIASVGVAFLGGPPVTNSYIRSEALDHAGARTRMAPFVHAAFAAALVPAVLAADQWVPVSALAGVVAAHTISLLRIEPFREIWNVSRTQALVAMATAGVIVFSDLLDGVQLGLVLTLLVVMVRVARSRVTFHRGAAAGAHQVHFSGPLTFISVPDLARLREALASVDVSTGVIFDVRSVNVVDHTAAERFIAMVKDIVNRGGFAAVLGTSPSCRKTLVAADRDKILDQRLAVTDKDVDRILGRERAFEMRAQVVANLERFRSDVREHYSPLLEQFEDGQHPHTLFITCVDSRVAPELMTGAHPGELFIVRCLGAMITPATQPDQPAAGAAVEYAVGVLGVRNIVVCGHSHCGAVKAVKAGHVPAELATLNRWLQSAPSAAGDLREYEDLDDAVRSVVIRQIDNLMAYPIVQKAVDGRLLSLHAWFYDVGKAELFEYDPEKKQFAVLAAARMASPLAGE